MKLLGCDGGAQTCCSLLGAGHPHPAVNTYAHLSHHRSGMYRTWFVLLEYGCFSVPTTVSFGVKKDMGG